jgi:4-hydroxythreonine-4-phosphate dehydrogenase
MRPLAITMGDPAGIGPEIIGKLFLEELPAPALVVGDETILARALDIVAPGLAIHRIARPADLKPARDAVPLLPVGHLPADLPFGREDARAGRAAADYIEKAVALALAGEVRAVVTAPINKAALKLAHVPFPGHTEMLAHLAGGAEVAMLLANDELRVLLVSIHVSLADAIRAVTFENELRAIRQADAACRQLGVARPRVAVAGLNPHAGEGGLFGAEDGSVIAPAVAAARAEGIDASGPWPGDTVFLQARQGRFDIVVAQYHDQGLIPVKYLGLEEGVNVTVGLPFVRTSPDHGTAFDIAGTGKADHASLRAAVRRAVRLTAA